MNMIGKRILENSKQESQLMEQNHPVVIYSLPTAAETMYKFDGLKQKCYPFLGLGPKV